MGNEVQVQKTTGGLTFKVPPHLLAKMAAKGGNISAGGTGGNALLIEGKRWVIRVGSEEKACTRPLIIQKDDGTYGPDPSGAREPAQTVNVIVIDQSARGHTYYPGTYVKGQGGAPACWSEDGRKPSPAVAEPQSHACDVCPKGQKGSAGHVDYPNMKACSDVKKLVVQMCSQRGVEYGIPPLSLKLAISSIWDQRDDQAMADGWYAWDNYVKFLADNGCTRTNAVVTQMRFGSGTLNIQFKLVGFTEEDDFDKTTDMADTDEVKKLLTIFRGEPAKKEGKPLPQDDGSTQQPLAPAQQDKLAAAQNEAAALAKFKQNAEEAAERARVIAQAEAEAAKSVAAAKAKKIADAKAALAALEAEEGGFDDAPGINMAALNTILPAADTPAQVEEKKRTRRTKAEMEAARAAEAAKAAPVSAGERLLKASDEMLTSASGKAEPAHVYAPQVETPEAATSFGPMEIPADLLADLPAFD